MRAARSAPSTARRTRSAARRAISTPTRAASSGAARRRKPRRRRGGSAKPSVEAAGRVRQHGVDLAGFRGEVRARHHLTAVVARHLLEQPLELADIAVHRLLELAVGAVFATDLVERLLAL